MEILSEQLFSFSFFWIGVKGLMLMSNSGSVICMVNDIPTINKYGELEIIHTMRPGPFGLRKVQRSYRGGLLACVTAMMR